MPENHKCAYPYCSCPVEPGSKYCSANCEDSRDTAEIFCDCGHEECEGGVNSAARRIA